MDRTLQCASQSEPMNMPYSPENTLYVRSQRPANGLCSIEGKTWRPSEFGNKEPEGKDYFRPRAQTRDPGRWGWVRPWFKVGYLGVTMTDYGVMETYDS
jgi:hypothetical protein